MGSGSWMDYQAFYIRHICQQGKDFQVVNELVSLLLTSLYFKRKDGTAAVGEIFLVQSVVWMAGQRRMVHLFHLRMVCQEFHYFFGVFRMAVQPEGKGLHPLQQKKSVKWGDGCAGVP